MAKKKQDDPPKGSPAWMSTFSDLMNLLLCFFVLLFSMSTVNEEKFQLVIASLQSSISILPAGSTSIGEGELVSAGVSQLEFLDRYYHELSNSASDQETEENGRNDVFEAFQEEALEESAQMAQQLQESVNNLGIQNEIEIEFNSQYVSLDLRGAILFESGKAEIRTEAYPLVDKIGVILSKYDNNVIEIEGHTDNVPINSPKYENNDVLSMFRALRVAEYIREITDLNPAYIKSSGRGEYVPIADNATAEGRARNRRVEIKIYNSFNSNLQTME